MRVSKVSGVHVCALPISPTNLAFGTQRLSTTSPAQTVTLTNSGTATLSITSIARARPNSSDFAVSCSGVGPCPLAGGPVAASASCAFTVTFTPAATGARTATVTITDDAPGSPQSVSLAGTGIVPAVTLAPTNLAFGTQRLSTTSPVQTVILTNSGTATLSITSIVLAGLNPGDFAIAAGTTCTNVATVVAGASCLVNLTFTPTAASARTATVTITDDAPGSPQSVSLAGTGIFFFNDSAPTEIYSLSLHDALPISVQTVILTNSGTATLSITSIALAGSNPG